MSVQVEMSVAKVLLVNSLHVGVFDSRRTSWRVQDSFRADARIFVNARLFRENATLGAIRVAVLSRRQLGHDPFLARASLVAPKSQERRIVLTDTTARARTHRRGMFSTTREASGECP